MPELQFALLNVNNVWRWHASVPEANGLRIPFRGDTVERQFENVRRLAEHMRAGQEVVAREIGNVLALTNASRQLTPQAAVQELFVANESVLYGAPGGDSTVIFAEGIGELAISIWTDVVRVGGRLLALL